MARWEDEWSCLVCDRILDIIWDYGYNLMTAMDIAEAQEENRKNPTTWKAI